MEPMLILCNKVCHNKFTMRSKLFINSSSWSQSNSLPSIWMLWLSRSWDGNWKKQLLSGCKSRLLLPQLSHRYLWFNGFNINRVLYCRRRTSVNWIFRLEWKEVRVILSKRNKNPLTVYPPTFHYWTLVWNHSIYLLQTAMVRSFGLLPPIFMYIMLPFQNWNRVT